MSDRGLLPPWRIFLANRSSRFLCLKLSRFKSATAAVSTGDWIASASRRLRLKRVGIETEQNVPMLAGAASFLLEGCLDVHLKKMTAKLLAVVSLFKHLGVCPHGGGGGDVLGSTHNYGKGL